MPQLVIDLNTEPPTLSEYLSSPPVYAPNGGTFHNGLIYWGASGGNDSIGGIEQRPGLVTLNPTTNQTTTILNNYFGYYFNTVDDLFVHPTTGDVWFTDPRKSPKTETQKHPQSQKLKTPHRILLVQQTLQHSPPTRIRQLPLHPQHRLRPPRRRHPPPTQRHRHLPLPAHSLHQRQRRHQRQHFPLPPFPRRKLQCHRQTHNLRLRSQRQRHLSDEQARFLSGAGRGAGWVEGGEEWVRGYGDGHGGRCVGCCRDVVGAGADEFYGAEFRVDGGWVEDALGYGTGGCGEGGVGVAGTGIVMGEPIDSFDFLVFFPFRDVFCILMAAKQAIQAHFLGSVNTPSRKCPRQPPQISKPSHGRSRQTSSSFLIQPYTVTSISKPKTI